MKFGDHGLCSMKTWVRPTLLFFISMAKEMIKGIKKMIVEIKQDNSIFGKIISSLVCLVVVLVLFAAVIPYLVVVELITSIIGLFLLPVVAMFSLCLCKAKPGFLVLWGWATSFPRLLFSLILILITLLFDK
eukprot:TRINITY_DN8342_c0_g1_i1.p1 TRINITY_DN8342_c0_g1~~TRINITY_DN8342_c0_g1_i1.p1  ORF type:complete len:132 (-),score=28.38 TRINITY_DN8342_c0_g1_i1:14-409(-)